MAKEKKLTDLEVYEQIMSDRPYKLGSDDVGYRDGEDKYRCGTCIHFFRRVIDAFGVCELVRLADDEPIEASKVCTYWTDNGKDFPLL